MFTAKLLGAIALLLLAYGCERYYAFRRRIPPGPKGIPFIGNIHQAPSEHPWRELAKWHKQYGPIFSVQYGAQTFVMLGTHVDAEALLDKRSNIYSSRPNLPMVNDCLSKNRRIIFLTFGDTWRTHNRLMGGFLTRRMSDTYREIQDVESAQLMTDFLKSPDFVKHFTRFSSSLGFALGYGKRMPRGDEAEVVHAEKLIAILNDVFIQRWIVDAIPILNRLPKMLAPWKRFADRLSSNEVKFFNEMREGAEAEEAWNWTKQVKSMKESDKLSSTERSFVVSAAYEAGSDTTSIALQIFILAAVLHPAKMQKAQRELDQVVGRDRMPDFDDLENLPYIEAIIKEVHRWRPVIPNGVPHAVIQDDEYKGYMIPKNTAVQANHWAISMNEDVYDAPEAFNPDRWIENPHLPGHVTFGFGRRMCMGRYVVNNSLFIVLSRMLWAFNILPGLEERNGALVECRIDPMAFTTTFNSSPLPFKARFEPRDDLVDKVIARAWEHTETDLNAVLGRIRAKQTH